MNERPLDNFLLYWPNQCAEKGVTKADRSMALAGVAFENVKDWIWQDTI
jgi:hypothetical protein